jgi:hypothetical protein
VILSNISDCLLIAVISKYVLLYIQIDGLEDGYGYVYHIEGSEKATRRGDE